MGVVKRHCIRTLEKLKKTLEKEGEYSPDINRLLNKYYIDKFDNSNFIDDENILSNRDYIDNIEYY